MHVLTWLLMCAFYEQNIHLSPSSQPLELKPQSLPNLVTHHLTHTVANTCILQAVNTWSEAELGRIIREYGEEKLWRQVASRCAEQLI